MKFIMRVRDRWLFDKWWLNYFPTCSDKAVRTVQQDDFDDNDDDDGDNDVDVGDDSHDYKDYDDNNEFDYYNMFLWMVLKIKMAMENLAL